MKKIIFLLLLSGLCAKEFSLDTLKAMCFRKDSVSCNYVGSWYRSNYDSDSTALKESKIYYQLSCKFGNVDGCFNVGLSYQNGLGTMQSDNAAKAYFDVACIGGQPEACFEMGMINSTGEMTEAKKEDAMYFFKKSCYFGNNLGCNHLELLKKLPN